MVKNIISLALLIVSVFGAFRHGWETFTYKNNLLNAIAIVVIMALAVRAGNFRMVMVEIPFLLMPLVMIWLKYPFKDKF